METLRALAEIRSNKNVILSGTFCQHLQCHSHRAYVNYIVILVIYCYI